ncbi:uncharacterized protein LOC119084633 [Bradysia coprophila]|uniref:uncharacterized protein LOC119084633 n=1 Tax=Bradysia coprophila TaxID=38358 RepID=UPI00187DD259|nr:uncharacterized protein LOC119084633 [Bradysia coprophila]
MKFIFICFAVIAALTVVICSSPDKSWCNDCNKFCVTPNLNRQDPLVRVALRKFQRKANNVCKKLCNYITEPNANPDVQQSALNINNNMYELCGVANTVASEIVDNCNNERQKTWASFFVTTDLAGRVDCFELAIKEADPIRALTNLSTCVNAREAEDNQQLAAYSPDCQSIATDILRTILEPVQGYYADRNRFPVDISTIVQYNSLK